MTEPVLAYIGIGANLGNAAQTISQAISALQMMPATTWKASSSLFTSAPVDATGNDFINAVVSYETTLSAEALLEHLQRIERQFGRERPFKNAPRTLDLDLLLYGSQTIANAVLNVPHPHMTERAFVLRPLLELDYAIEIPGKGLARDYLANVANQRIHQLDS